VQSDPPSSTTLLASIPRADGHPALVAPGGDTVTFSELHEVVDRLARELAGAGVRPGDTVALSMDNGPAVVLAFLAVVAVGAGAAPLNQAYTEAEFRTYLDMLRPSAMLFRGDTAAVAKSACSALGVRVLELSEGPARELSFGVTPGDGLDPSPDAIALLLHTSGTTGRPKLVPLRQRNLAYSMRTIAAGYQLTERDVSLCVMPLFHVHGLVASTLSALHAGGTVVAPPRFSASAFWPDAVRFGATWYSAVPTIHHVLASASETTPVPEHALRFARSCSSALPPSLQEALEERFGVPVLQAYGMTEASHQMTSNPLPPGERRAGTVGPATGIEVAVVDDEWQAVAVGEAGEVVVRGASVVDGYLDSPEATAASFREGWFRTGDSGRLSADGYLTLDGRLKELINRGGEKISPHEVEDALLEHPAVAQAVAYALPDAKYGEQVAVAVVLGSATSADDLTRHCQERLAAFKVPVSIAMVEKIPTGPTGKVQRRLLADLLS
jgi:oxalate---CoA ligase